MLALVLGAALLSPGVRQMPPHVLLMAALSGSTPMMDTTSDLLVTASFAASGDWTWFTIAVVDLGVAGLFGAFSAGSALLGSELSEKLPGMLQLPVGVLCLVLGFVGLAPLVHTVAILHKAAQDGEGKGDEDEAVAEDTQLKAKAGLGKVLELASETAPQATLQAYVGRTPGEGGWGGAAHQRCHVP